MLIRVCVCAFCRFEDVQFSMQQSELVNSIFDNCSASNESSFFDDLVPDAYDDFMSTWFYLLVCLLLLIAAQFTAYACVTVKRNTTLYAVNAELFREFEKCQTLLQGMYERATTPGNGLDAETQLSASDHDTNELATDEVDGDASSNNSKDDSANTDSKKEAANCSAKCYDCCATFKVKAQGWLNILLYAVLERLLVPAVGEKPSIDVVGEKHWIVLGDFFWPEELNTVKRPPTSQIAPSASTARTCAAIDPPVVRCSMTMERTATHSRDMLENCNLFLEELKATKTLARQAHRRSTRANIRGDGSSPPSARQQRMDHILEVRRAIETAVSDYFAKVRQLEEAAAQRVRLGAPQSRLSRLRQSATRLQVYEQVLRDHPELVNVRMSDDAVDSLVGGVHAASDTPRSASRRLKFRDMLVSSAESSPTARAELEAAIQEDLIDAPALVAKAKTVMVDFARMPVQPLRHHRVKLSPNGYVLLLIFFYPGCITVATSISQDSHWYGPFGAFILFAIFAVFVNFMIAHHLLRFVCKKRAIHFSSVTHSWSDASTKVFDKLWEPIHSTVRAGEPGTLAHHIYLYRIGYFVLLMIKAVVLGLGTTGLNASDQLGLLITVEVLMIVTFALSLGPFATLIVNIAQPVVHGLNIIIFTVALAYDQTACELSQEAQDTLTVLGVVGVALPVLLVIVRVVELKVRLWLHQRALTQAQQLELVAQGGATHGEDESSTRDSTTVEVSSDMKQIDIELVSVTDGAQGAAEEAGNGGENTDDISALSDDEVEMDSTPRSASTRQGSLSRPGSRRRSSGLDGFSLSKLQRLISAADLLQSIREAKTKLADARVVSFRVELDDAMGHSALPVRQRSQPKQGAEDEEVPAWPSMWELAALLSSEKELEVVRERFEAAVDIQEHMGALSAEALAVDDDVRQLSQQLLEALARSLNGKHIRVSAVTFISSWWRKRADKVRDHQPKSVAEETQESPQEVHTEETADKDSTTNGAHEAKDKTPAATSTANVRESSSSEQRAADTIQHNGSNSASGPNSSDEDLLAEYEIVPAGGGAADEEGQRDGTARSAPADNADAATDGAAEDTTKDQVTPVTEEESNADTVMISRQSSLM